MNSLVDRDGDMFVFTAVMDAGSFAGAAPGLGMTPSGVSRRISRLEARLGVRLLNRTTRKISLTEAGARFHQRALQITAEIEDAEREAAELQATPRGRLRITAGNAYGSYRLMPLIPDFLAAYPEIEVELTLLDRLVDLVGEGFDIAFRSGEVPDSSLMARRLPDVQIATCAAPAYLARHGTPKRPEDLTEHNCLIHMIGERRLDRWVFGDDEDPLTVLVSGSLQANNLEILYRAAIAGLGIVRAPKLSMMAAIHDGRLVMILPDHGLGSSRPMRMMYPTNRQLSPKVRAFIDFAVDYWRDDR